MVCPECQLSNPAGSLLCLKCKTPLESGGNSTEEQPIGDAWTSALTSAGATPSAGEAPTLTIGSVFGRRYEILQLLGEGGMGAVYKARDLEVDRLVALKVIRPELAGNPQVLRRFKQELILTSKITHKNVIRIYDLGQAEGVKYISMEFIAGQDLRTLLRNRTKFKSEEAVRIIQQICRALEAAHSEGVIHRDLKPHNIMVDANGRVSVMDFGIAHSMEGSGITQTGALLGTPEYMSPEQARGTKVDERSDLFSLGIVFYELLTGKTPFQADTMLGTLVRRTQERAVPPVKVDPSIPQYVSDVITRCLATHPEDRYQSATEVLQELETWQPTRQTPLTRVSTRPAPAVPARDWKRHGKWMAIATTVLVLAVVAFLLRDRFTSSVAAPRQPVSVLVADFHNTTGDPIFDGTLEQVFNIALEGASFINSYSRGEARKLAATLQPNATRLDEPLARLVALREGLSYIVTGSIALEGRTYRLSARALNAAGKLAASGEMQAGNKESVMVVVGKLAARIRTALGDDTPESLQLAAAETFSAASLEAAHSYAQGQELLWAGKAEDAIRSYLRAVELDPNLGRAYASLSAAYANREQRQLAEQYFQMAMARIDRMTDREKYRTRGVYYLLVRNTQKAIEEFSALLKRYPGDLAGLSNLALAYQWRREMSRALEEGRRATQLYPKYILPRNNLANSALYAGDFDTAVREAKAVLELNPSYSKAYITLALSALAQGRPGEAAEIYGRLKGLDKFGASRAAIGLADVALYEGRVADAVALLEQGAQGDLANNSPGAAARKLSMLAEAQLLLAGRAAALLAAERALAASLENSVLYSVAQVYLQTGQESKAQALATELRRRLEPDPQAYAKLLEGEALLKRGKAREAIPLFQEAQKLAETWLGHFALGRAYLEAGAFTEADSEFDVCVKRRGEAAEAFLDPMPTYRYVPPLYYYRGRALEGLKSPGAAQAYKTLLAVKERAVKDPLVEAARRRLEGR